MEFTNLVKKLAGQYFYERVGHDQRILELLPNGTIGLGTAGLERSWTATFVNGECELRISGEHGVTCRLFHCGQGVFRGHWQHFEKMSIVLSRCQSLAPLISNDTLPNPVTGLRQRSAIIERLGREDVPIVEIAFGCARVEKLLCSDGVLRGTASDDERWDWDGVNLVISDTVRETARYRICANPRELQGRWLKSDQPLAKLALKANPITAISPKSVCIVIGSYEQPEWAIANARACRLLNPGCPVLVFDNRSDAAVIEQLLTAANKYGFRLQVANQRNQHYQGDVEVLKAGFKFARECGASYLARCNQRTIQLRQDWATEAATVLAADDAALGYQCYLGEPFNIRTELLTFNVTRWEQCSEVIEYGKLSASSASGLLFENWFSQLAWELFPWQHTSIPWFSRNRCSESEFTLSYYGGTNVSSAVTAIDLRAEQLSVRAPNTAHVLQLYTRALRTPSDISEHVPTLRLLASQCHNIIEFGVRSGVSTDALLSGIAARPGTQLISYDIVRSADVDELEAAGGSAFIFLLGDSRQVAIETTDLLFIDTYHSGVQLWEELTRHQKSVKKWIVLHDTVVFSETGENGEPGLMSAVRRFVSEFPQWSIVAEYLNNNGLTILEHGP
jgi:predicted O-methyltransferase YrrM